MGVSRVTAAVQQSALLTRKTYDYLRAEGLVGFSIRLRRWLNKQWQTYDVVVECGVPHIRNRYSLWVAAHMPSAAELDRQRALAATLAYQPTISLMTPVFNPPPEVLRATLDSVLAQTYGRWELCLADGASTRPGVRAVLEEYAQRDVRLRVRFLPDNLGISGNSNAAAQLATGEYLMIFDHDDLLPPHALFEIAYALNQQPGVDLVYVDEDLVTYDGRRRFNPNFKPNWSPEMLLTANYLMHSVIRRNLFWAVGGFDAAYDGAQDWDLAFKVTERTTRILHIPQVLYHWRTVPGSAASSFAAKPYVFEHQLGAVAHHLRRQGIAGAEARFDAPGFVHVTWPASGQRVSVILTAEEKPKHLRRTLTSLLRTTYPDIEVLVVPLDGSDTWAQRQMQGMTAPWLRTITHDGHLTEAQARNLGAAHASGNLLLFLRPGLEAKRADWLEELARWAERPEVGVVGPKIVDRHNRTYHAGLVFGLGGHAAGPIFRDALERQGGPFGNVDWYRNYAALSGDCQMMRRDVFTRVGGYDASAIATDPDVMLCLRAGKLGYRHIYTPYSCLRAHQSRGTVEHNQPHATTFGVDPYFNPNLTLNQLVPSL